MRTFKIWLFFNLAFIPILVLSFCAAAYIIANQLRANAEQEVMENARLVMQMATASRSYTIKQIVPLLDHEQARVYRANDGVYNILDKQLPFSVQKAIDSIPRPKDKEVLVNVRQQIIDNVRKEALALPGPEFYPQSIPFYASTETFNYFRSQNPD